MEMPSHPDPLPASGERERACRVAAGLANMSNSAPATDPILTVEHIVKRFETQDGVLIALDDVSFNVTPGEFLAVIGPSGCGKSTLFNVIGGLVDGYDGRVMVGGDMVR